jgi:hypothetical protein
MIDSTHTPIRRSGNDKSQTIGAAINASKAIGQLSTKRTHQAMNRSRTFMTASAGDRVMSVSLRRTFRITDRRRQRALAVNPASKEPGASKLTRGAAVRVNPIVGLRGLEAHGSIKCDSVGLCSKA